MATGGELADTVLPPAWRRPEFDFAESVRGRIRCAENYSLVRKREVVGDGRPGYFRGVNAILEPLVQSPKFFDYLDELQDVKQREQQKRERFYEEITPEAKWEFINGEVIMHSPAKARHTKIRGLIERLITTWVSVQGVGWAGGEKSLVCLTRNDYEPDVLYFGREKAARIEPDLEKFPAPDFVVEVLSPSTRHRDRGIKFTDYAAHGVGEYWIVDPVADTIEQYLLEENGTYGLAAKQADGTLRSRVIEGFAMPVRAAFDDKENLGVLWSFKP